VRAQPLRASATRHASTGEFCKSRAAGCTASHTATGVSIAHKPANARRSPVAGISSCGRTLLPRTCATSPPGLPLRSCESIHARTARRAPSHAEHTDRARASDHAMYHPSDWLRRTSASAREVSRPPLLLRDAACPDPADSKAASFVTRKRAAAFSSSARSLRSNHGTSGAAAWTTSDESRHDKRRRVVACDQVGSVMPVARNLSWRGRARTQMFQPGP